MAAAAAAQIIKWAAHCRPTSKLSALGSNKWPLQTIGPPLPPPLASCWAPTKTLSSESLSSQRRARLEIANGIT